MAGDYIKECSDLGVPMVAVGFMYPEGYSSQKIRMDGWQEDVAEVLDRDAAPINGCWTRRANRSSSRSPFSSLRSMWRYGRWTWAVSLYLLDTDIEINDPWNRTIASHLYIGDIEQRLRQEIVLGIGGIAVLKTLGIKHSVLHLNEGHSAFALLERIRERIEEGMRYEDAVER